jgi:NAD(P)-dependent dehydrogenase (short-subunit alcohol dehydrogenase family)
MKREREGKSEAVRNRRESELEPKETKTNGRSCDQLAFRSVHAQRAMHPYTASKHGVLGLMRALDPVAAEGNVRLAVIHPWFAGALADLYAVSILIFS